MSESDASASHQSLRIFVAIPVPQDIARQLRSVQAHLAEAARLQRVKLRLTPNHQFHMTLAFLGNIDQGKLSSVLDATANATRGCPPCTVKPQGFVALPSANRARVITIAFEEASGRLASFVVSLHANLRQCGCALESRAFYAHVTLARMRYAQCAPGLSSSWVESIGPMQPREVAVFQSVLKPSGAEYRRLFSVDIKNA